jgi:hypothetical protein
MPEYFRDFLHQAGVFGRRNEPTVKVALFGKHPAWNDHIAPPFGVDTDSLRLAKAILYDRGIAEVIDGGGWKKLEDGARIPSFGHAFVWRRRDEFLCGWIWATSDGVGRREYPLILTAQVSGADFARCVDSVLDILESAGRKLGMNGGEGIGALVKSVQSDPSAQGSLRESVRTEIERLPNQLKSACLVAESTEGRAGVLRSRFSAFLDSDSERVKRVIYQLRVRARSFLRNANAKWDSEHTPTAHIRIPTLFDTPSGDLVCWANYLGSYLDADAPMLLVCRSGREHRFMDVIVGLPKGNDLLCLQASSKVIPLESEIGFSIDEMSVREFDEKTRQFNAERDSGSSSSNGSRQISRKLAMVVGIVGGVILAGLVFLWGVWSRLPSGSQRRGGEQVRIENDDKRGSNAPPVVIDNPPPPKSVPPTFVVAVVDPTNATAVGQTTTILAKLEKVPQNQSYNVTIDLRGDASAGPAEVGILSGSSEFKHAIDLGKKFSTNLAPGLCVLTYSHKLFGTNRSNFEIPKSGATNITIEFSFGAVGIRSSVNLSLIELGSEKSNGTQALFSAVKPGPVTIVAWAPGYKTNELRMTVEAGRMLGHELNMERLPTNGWVNLMERSPEGVEFRLNEHRYDFGQPVPLGTNRFAAYFQNQELVWTNVVAVGSKTNRIEWRFGEAQVVTNPTNAVVTVKGVATNGRRQVGLVGQPVEMIVRADGYTATNFTRVFQPGLTNWSVNLAKLDTTIQSPVTNIVPVVAAGSNAPVVVQQAGAGRFRERTNSIGMVFVWVPDIPGGRSGQPPADKGAWVGKYEVTQKEYQDVMGANPSFGTRGDQYPVQTITVTDVLEFIRKLELRESQGSDHPRIRYSLPSAEQWNMYAAGANLPERVVRDVSEAAQVGSKSANKFGLYDVVGNVAEILPNGRFIGGSHRNFPSDLTQQSLSNVTASGRSDVGFRLIMFDN